MATRCKTARWTRVEIDSLPDLMSVEECALLLRMAQVTVRKKCRDGEIAAKKFGEKWLISKSKLKEQFDMA